MNDKILKEHAPTGWVLIAKGILIVVLIYTGLEFSQSDEILPKSGICVFAPMVNTEWRSS